MADFPDGHAAPGPQARDDDDPDSPGRSFFARLFRRDSPDESDADDEDRPARGTAPGELSVNLRSLRGMRVEDVSIPRPEIAAIPADSRLDDVVAAFRESTVSRLPVYAETLDQPLGLVHLKDLALVHGFGAPSAGFDLKGLLRPLLYAPPSMPIGVLLRKMQAARIHMALVIDEYGGVDGLVTFEDLLEPVIGDIADEHDEEEDALWTEEGPGLFLAQARMDLDDFEAAAGTRLVDPELASEVDTLGGLVIRLAGRVPGLGEAVRHPDGHMFEIVDADARRIKRLRVRLSPAAAAAAE